MDTLHGREHVLNVFVDGEAELIGALYNIFAADVAGKARGRKFLLDSNYINVGKFFRRADERYGHNKAGQLINSKNGFFHEGRARGAGVG